MNEADLPANLEYLSPSSLNSKPVQKQWPALGTDFFSQKANVDELLKIVTDYEESMAKIDQILGL